MDDDPPSLNLHRRIAGYAIGDVIGVGAFGEVRFGQSFKTGQVVAVKIVDELRLRESSASPLDREIDILRSVEHPNIVRVIEVIQNVQYKGTWCSCCACTEFQSSGALGRCVSCGPHDRSHHSLEETRAVSLVIQELALGGELFTIVVHCGPLPESIARYYFRQLLAGLRHCHERGIVHRDLKPENLLFDHDFTLKIVDFGLAANVRESADGDRVPALQTGLGSTPYSAPEAFYAIDCKSDYEGEPADIWSCAVILYIMLTGRPPFRRPLRRTINSSLRRCQHFTNLLAGYFPEVVGGEARDLLRRMFRIEPSDRLTLDEIEAHGWLQADVDVPDRRVLVEFMRDVTLRSWRQHGKHGLAFMLKRTRDKADAAQEQQDDDGVTSTPVNNLAHGDNNVGDLRQRLELAHESTVEVCAGIATTSQVNADDWRRALDSAQLLASLDEPQQSVYRGIGRQRQTIQALDEGDEGRLQFEVALEGDELHERLRALLDRKGFGFKLQQHDDGYSVQVEADSSLCTLLLTRSEAVLSSGTAVACYRQSQASYNDIRQLCDDIRDLDKLEAVNR